MGGNLLSDAALHQVRELIKQESGRARGERTWEEPDPTTGPECFLAYTATAIPAMTLESLGYTPGYALCNLYKLDRFSGVLEDLKLDSATPNRRGVYNSSTNTVKVGWFPVWRDKSGTWWATASGIGSIICTAASGTGFFDYTDTTQEVPVSNNLKSNDTTAWIANTSDNRWTCKSAGWWEIHFNFRSRCIDFGTDDFDMTTILLRKTSGLATTAISQTEVVHVAANTTRSTGVFQSTAWDFALDDELSARVDCQSGHTCRCVNWRWVMHSV